MEIIVCECKNLWHFPMLYSNMNSLTVNRGPKHVGGKYVIIKEYNDKVCCDVVFSLKCRNCCL